jgi:hypothetical protein
MRSVLYSYVWNPAAQFVPWKIYQKPARPIVPFCAMGGSHTASPTTPSPVGGVSLRKASFEESPAMQLTPAEVENCKAALNVLQERIRVPDGIEHEWSALQVTMNDINQCWSSWCA